MIFELRQLSINNGMDEYTMLQEIGNNEYGFTNEVKEMPFGEYKKWLIQEENYSKAIDLPENWIPQTTYFFYANMCPVGIARIRHFSSNALEEQGVGNFGYGIAKSHRGKGYGNALFPHILQKCKLLGYKKTKSFVNIDNIASNKIFLASGAVLVGTFHNNKNIYEIDIL